MTPSVEELQAAEREALANGNGDGDVTEGMSIEDMEAAGLMPDEPEKEAPVIEGITGQLSLSVGGRKPDSATMRMGAKEVQLADKTQFPKGSKIKLHVLASIDEVKLRDKKDDAGEPTHCTRVHLAVPLSVQRLSPLSALEGAVMDFLFETDASDHEDDLYTVVRKVVENVIVKVQEDEAEIK